MTPTDREQQARAFVADYSLGNNVERLIDLLADTERATLERVVKDAKQRAYGIGLNEPMRTNHLYAFACDLEQQAKEIPS